MASEGKHSMAPGSQSGLLRFARNDDYSHPKMLAQLQALRLIVGADALAVHGMGPGQHFLIYQPADDLAVLEDERHFTRTHFQHRAGALPAGAGVPEAGMEEAGIIHPEFAAQ